MFELSSANFRRRLAQPAASTPNTRTTPHQPAARRQRRHHAARLPPSPRPQILRNLDRRPRRGAGAGIAAAEAHRRSRQRPLPPACMPAPRAAAAARRASAGIMYIRCRDRGSTSAGSPKHHRQHMMARRRLRQMHVRLQTNPLVSRPPAPAATRCPNTRPPNSDPGPSPCRSPAAHSAAAAASYRACGAPNPRQNRSTRSSGQAPPYRPDPERRPNKPATCEVLIA